MKPIPGSPCQNCDFSYRCADDDRTCEEYNRWFGPWLRREMRELRLKYGVKKEFRAWRYFAPYEPVVTETDARAAFKIDAAKTLDFETRIAELDRLQAASRTKDRKVQIVTAFTDGLNSLMQALKLGSPELAKRSGFITSRIQSYRYGYYCPRGENWEAIKKGLREKWEEVQRDA